MPPKRATAKVTPTVIDSDDDRYTFRRIASTLYMIHPSGHRERVASYRDAVWKMGMQSDGSVPSGPPSFVRAWTAAVSAVFPTYRAGCPTSSPRSSA